MEGLVISAPVDYKHKQQQEKIKKVRETLRGKSL